MPAPGVHVPALVTVNCCAINVPPAVILIDPVLPAPVAPMVTIPATVRVFPLANVNVAAAPPPVVPVLILRIAHEAVVVLMVTVEPLTIVTLSAAPGTTPPTQVAVALQLPPAAVLEIFAAFAKKDVKSKTSGKIKVTGILPVAMRRVLFIVSLLKGMMVKGVRRQQIYIIITPIYF